MDKEMVRVFSLNKAWESVVRYLIPSVININVSINVPLVKQVTNQETLKIL
jgi:hypothetical protein